MCCCEGIRSRRLLAVIGLVKILTLGLALLSMNAVLLDSTGEELVTVRPVMWTVVVVLAGAWLVRGTRRMRLVELPWLRASAW